jgi:tetratricopeptide (TPR) repeat protein/photosystem II stability/assembly factor-like uncharacterized protein
MTDRRDKPRLVVISSKRDGDQRLTRYGPFQGPPGQPPGPGDGEWRVLRPSKPPDKTPYLIPIPIGLILCLAINLLRACASNPGSSIPQTTNNPFIGSPRDYSDLRRGTQAYFLGEYDKAIMYFTMALESEADLTEVYNRRALAYHEKGEYGLALEDYGRALEREPDSAMVYNNRAVTYAALLQLDKAMADLDRAIEIDPRFGKAHYNRGLLYSSRREYDAAIANLTQALEYPARPPSPWRTMESSLFSEERLAEVARENPRALALLLDPDDLERELAETGADEPSVRYYRALAYQAKEEYDSALADLDEAIKLLSERLPEATPFPSVQASTPLTETLAAFEEEDRPQDPRVDLPSVYYLRALVDLDKGEYGRAPGDLQKVLELAADEEMRAQAELVLAMLGAVLPGQGAGLPESVASSIPYGLSEGARSGARATAALPAATALPAAWPVETPALHSLPAGVWTSMGLGEHGVETLVTNPIRPSILYAGTHKGGVFKSADGGSHWAAANAGLADLCVVALAIDPLTPQTLYAGTCDGGVFKSVDAGASWSAASDGLASLRVAALAIDPRAPSTLYASAYGAGVFRSTDGGDTWQAAGDGLGDGIVHVLAVDPATPTTLYAGGQGMYKSTDGGATWRAIQTGLELYETSKVRSLAIDPTSPATLYAGTQSLLTVSHCVLFKSIDGGETWSCSGSDLDSIAVFSLAINPRTPSTVYAGTGRGVFRSSDRGSTWSQFGSGMDAGYVYALALDPLTLSMVYAARFPGGVFAVWQGGGP